jgi:L-malate glycosyltransferase
MRPLTVLHLVANRWWTGSADPVITLARGLRERGHTILLGAIPGDRFEQKAREAGFELVPGVRLDTGFSPAGLIADVSRLRRLVRMAAVDLVHAHHSHDHWLAWLVASPGGRRRRGRLPVVRTFHHRRAVKRDRTGRWLYRRTAAVFAASRHIEARCRDAGIPPGRIFIVPGAADLARFAPDGDPRPIRGELGLGDVPVVACVARLAPDRGHDVLISAFQLVLDRLPEARLLLVGKGEWRGHLERRVGELGLAERVLFAGYRDGDLPLVLAAADCFALMRSGSDESCRAVLEAMAAGRPVVAGRGGALPETVLDGETGVLVDEGSPESVARALVAMLSDRARASRMGLAGRRRAEEVFAPRCSADVIERVYGTLA